MDTHGAPSSPRQFIGRIKFWLISVVPVCPALSLTALVTNGKYVFQCRVLCWSGASLLRSAWKIGLEYSEVVWGSPETHSHGQGLLWPLQKVLKWDFVLMPGSVADGFCVGRGGSAHLPWLGENCEGRIWGPGKRGCSKGSTKSGDESGKESIQVTSRAEKAIIASHWNGVQVSWESVKKWKEWEMW